MAMWVNKVFCTTEHWSNMGNQLNAQSHQHAFLHIVISLQKNTPIQGHIHNMAFSEQAIILDSNIVHALHINTPYWLILLNHTSTLGRCLQSHLQQNQQTHCPLLLDEHALNMFYQQCQIVDNAQDYGLLWQQLQKHLPTQTCDITHPSLDERIQTILQAQAPHFIHQGKIDWQAIREAIHLSPSRFSHLFSDETGNSFKNHVLFQQLSLAMWQIANGSSITQAAMDNGFDSASHLSSTCRKLMGVTPRLAKNQVLITH